jgi:hypothetical protein
MKPLEDPEAAETKEDQTQLSEEAKRKLRDGESDPGLPRDRQGY